LSPPPISPDQPELRLLAQLAGCAPSKLAAAFNNPEHLFKHVTLEQLARLKESCDRLAALMVLMTARADVALAAYSKGVH
jgi:hypothetical protein